MSTTSTRRLIGFRVWSALGDGRFGTITDYARGRLQVEWEGHNRQRNTMFDQRFLGELEPAAARIQPHRESVDDIYAKYKARAVPSAYAYPPVLGMVIDLAEEVREEALTALRAQWKAI